MTMAAAATPMRRATLRTASAVRRSSGSRRGGLSGRAREWEGIEPEQHDTREDEGRSDHGQRIALRAARASDRDRTVREQLPGGHDRRGGDQRDHPGGDRPRRTAAPRPPVNCAPTERAVRKAKLPPRSSPRPGPLPLLRRASAQGVGQCEQQRRGDRDAHQRAGRSDASRLARSRRRQRAGGRTARPQQRRLG